MRDFFKKYFSIHREPLWVMLLVLGLAFRIWYALVFKNPMDAIFSDPGRHWDNGKHFLDPGPNGATNPYLYQLFLWIAQQLTHEDKLKMGLIATALSLLYPLSWYLFASRVVKRRITALRFTAVLSFIPTHVVMFSYFMNETLMFPLLGFAMWATVKAGQRRSLAYFILASALWTMSVLTRSIVMPIGGLLMLWCFWKQKRKVISAFAGIALVCFGFGVAAVRAYPVIQRYTPFGDNLNVAVYFFSGAHDYTVSYARRGTYIYASPSLYISPFDPFYDWKSSRKGNVALTIDPDKKGVDATEQFKTIVSKNKKKLPRMIWENLIFMSFSHSWPDAGKGNLPAEICLWERWIWFPMILATFIGSLVYLRRRGRSFVPGATLTFILCVYAAQTAVIEGRYRKPLEPMLILSALWLLDARRSRPTLPPANLRRVIGFGGIAFKARDPGALTDWYARHLGVKPAIAGQTPGASFPWRREDEPKRRAMTVWEPLAADTTQFDPSGAPFMMRYMVDDLDAVLAALRAEGVIVEERQEDRPTGRFGWALDPEGNRVELWEPRKEIS